MKNLYLIFLATLTIFLFSLHINAKESGIRSIKLNMADGTKAYVDMEDAWEIIFRDGYIHFDYFHSELSIYDTPETYTRAEFSIPDVRSYEYTTQAANLIDAYASPSISLKDGQIICSQKAFEKGGLQLYDLSGKIIISSSPTISIAELAAGIYIIKNGSTTLKFQKK